MADEQPKRRTTRTAAAKPKAPAKARATTAAAPARKAPARKAAPAKIEAAIQAPAPAPSPTPAPAAKSAAKAKAPAKPGARTAKKPAAAKSAPRKAPAEKSATRQRVDTAKATVSAAGATVERAVSAVKKAAPEVTPRAGLFAALGTAAVAAGAFFVWRASRAEEPRYQTIESDGAIEIRKYPALVTAGTEHRGQRRAALEQGFRVLADYIFAKSRPGERLAMTAPVLSDSDGGSWRTRFLMPTGKARGELPDAPPGVELVTEPARRVAAIRFAGRADDADLETKENALRSWLQLRGLPHEGHAIHAFYNAPFLPGPMRRNEVMITLSEEGGTGAV